MSHIETLLFTKRADQFVTRDVVALRDAYESIKEQLAAANERAEMYHKELCRIVEQKPVAWAYRFSTTERHDDVHDDDAYFEVVYRTRRELSPDDPFGRRGRDFDDAADTTETALYAAPVPAAVAVPKVAPECFVAYMVKNYPPNTVIADAAWHARPIWSAVRHAILSTTDTEVKNG